VLESQLKYIVGGKTASAIERAFGYTTAGELLQHFPRRYSHRGELTPLRGLPIGEHVTVVAQVLDVTERSMHSRKGSLLEVRVTDGTGHLLLTFFNQPWRKKQLSAGVRGQFAGKVKAYRGNLQLQHPDYELFDRQDVAEDQAEALEEAAALAFSKRPVPVYSASSAVPSWVIARAVGLVLDSVGTIPDRHPEWLGLMPLSEALQKVHRPETDEQWRSARDSLKAMEAFDLQLALTARRQRAQSEKAQPRHSGSLLERFDARMPFQLTGDQQRVAAQLSSELTRSSPMNRLLQGEVGSGKTIVALRAMLQVAQDGGQSALLAPTEVLASQHFRSILQTLGDELVGELSPVLLTGKTRAEERRRSLLAVASGKSRIIVGTHALLSDTTTFADLGLVVIDEQHRFGVEQRESLRKKGRNSPHLLAMTATPIPRTVALTVFGDLDISTIRELPPGRPGIESFAIQVQESPKLEHLAWVRAREEIAAGRGVYVVCPAISAEEAEEGQKGRATVEAVAAQLRQRPDYADVRIAELTGGASAEVKEQVMRDFENGKIDILVATTVIEVGVNVPHATTMIVLEADRFGVSQLHQLRGRVGRGNLPGLCLLLTQAPLESAAWERIEAVANTADGFALAEVDLQQRKEGDILGTQQSGGRSTLKILRVVEDAEIIEQAHEWAGEAVARGITADLQAIIDEEEANLEQLAKS
jgi:ATP-dependent DNA helicase RecG